MTTHPQIYESGEVILDQLKSHATLYHQLKEQLSSKFKTGEWYIDKKIPTERELCKIYYMSRITVRKALDELEQEGYLYRKQGKGTFVTKPKMEQRLSRFYSFSEELRKMGYTPGMRILEFFITKADNDIAQKLGVLPGSEVYSLKRLRLADDNPFALEISLIPCEICPYLIPEEILKNGLYNTMKQRYGIIPEIAEEQFEAILIDKKNAELLLVKGIAAGILLERHTSAGGRIVEYCNSIIRGDMYKYKVVLKS